MEFTVAVIRPWGRSVQKTNPEQIGTTALQCLKQNANPAFKHMKIRIEGADEKSILLGAQAIVTTLMELGYIVFSAPVRNGALYGYTIIVRSRKGDWTAIQEAQF